MDIAYLEQRLGILFERLFGDNPLINTPKLCSRNFSEKRSVRGSIGYGFPGGMADCFPEEWGQGLEPWRTGPILAIDDSNAKFNLSTCPVHEHPVSPGEQGTGQGQTSQAAGQGCSFFARGKKEPEPQTCRGQGREPPKRRNSHNSQTHAIGPPEWSAVPAAASFPKGTSPKRPPPQKSAGQASVKAGGGGSSSGAS